MLTRKTQSTSAPSCHERREVKDTHLPERTPCHYCAHPLVPVLFLLGTVMVGRRFEVQGIAAVESQQNSFVCSLAKEGCVLHAKSTKHIHTFSALCLTCCASSTRTLVEWRKVGASPGIASCASLSAFCSACKALACSDNGCLARVIGAFLVPGGFRGLCLQHATSAKH